MNFPILVVIALLAECAVCQLPSLPNLNPLDLFYENVPFASNLPNPTAQHSGPTKIFKKWLVVSPTHITVPKEYIA